MKRAFTLIELLVVIAIIAILAAILFPVFAQAKSAAKKTQSLSNVKQLALGAIMYGGDSDDVFPLGCEGTDWGANGLWTGKVLPYLKSLPILVSPFDSEAGKFQPRPEHQWTGIGMSYAANATYGPDYNWTGGAKSDGFNWNGLFAYGQNFDNWFHGLRDGGRSSSAVTRPAETIMFAEKSHTKSKYRPGWVGDWFGPEKVGVRSGFSPNVLFLAGGTGGDWGDGHIPNGKADKNHADPMRRVNGAVEPGPNGQAVFSFADGHAASMRPEKTNPDSDVKETNMWNAVR
jgi:prepilin-type N-terminal cleavage/methylation domain-containing protein/prepilin-type processing-associated H-X9-DG protein